MTFAISICKEFFTGIICADAEKMDKMMASAAVSGFMNVEF